VLGRMQDLGNTLGKYVVVFNVRPTYSSLVAQCVACGVNLSIFTEDAVPRSGILYTASVHAFSNGYL
jgi:hypothetical protein